MLPRSHRLPALDIPRVMKHGTRVGGNGVILIYRTIEVGPSTTLGTTKRFAFVVSTKVDKRATVRNRVRRLMSESVRHHIDSIAGVDGVFIGSRGLAELTQVEVEKRVVEVLKKLS